MCTASPKMRSLPILALLVLFAYCTLPAQGYPSPTTYFTLIKEMMGLLNQPSVPPQVELEVEDRFILRNKNFLKTNLEEFLNAAENFKDRAERIRKILMEFQTVVPTASSTEDSITIDKNDWDDFRRKLKEYLIFLQKFITANILTTRSPSGPS